MYIPVIAPFGAKSNEAHLRQALRDKIAQRKESNIKAGITQFLNAYEDDVVQAAQERIEERYSNVIAHCRASMQTRAGLARQQEAMERNARDLAQGTKMLAALEADLQAAREEAEELRDCPCTDERVLVHLFRKLTEPAAKERNPYVKAQIIRTAGMIIAAKCGLQSVGGAATPAPRQEEADADTYDNEDVL